MILRQDDSENMVFLFVRAAVVVVIVVVIVVVDTDVAAVVADVADGSVVVDRALKARFYTTSTAYRCTLLPLCVFARPSVHLFVFCRHCCFCCRFCSGIHWCR